MKFLLEKPTGAHVVFFCQVIFLHGMQLKDKVSMLQ